MAKSLVVSAIWRCSGVKSSGKKQEAGVGLVIRKAPPGVRGAVGTAVIVAMVLLLVLARWAIWILYDVFKMWTLSRLSILMGLYRLSTFVALEA